MGVAEIASAAAFEKARLITEALDALREATDIDERESLDRESWVTWYDATVPDVRDIKMLAGAMEIELLRRRGEQIQVEGERRGGDSTKVTRCVTLDSATTTQRSRARAVAAQPERVAAFIKREIAAGRVPSVRGAVRAAQATPALKPAPEPTPIDTPPAANVPPSSHDAAARTRITRAHQRLFDRIATVSGVPRTVDDLGARLGLKGAETRRFLHDAALLPWVRIDRSGDAYTIHVDNNLRELCALQGPRPDVPGGSVAAFLGTLRREIVRRRKENHDEFRKRKWNHEGILKREQSAILDWIEEQLNQVPN